MKDDRCVICGDIIPEGYGHLCPNCRPDRADKRDRVKQKRKSSCDFRQNDIYLKHPKDHKKR